MANCLIHVSLPDDDLSKLCLDLQIGIANQSSVLVYLQIVP